MSLGIEALASKTRDMKMTRLTMTSPITAPRIIQFAAPSFDAIFQTHKKEPISCIPSISLDSSNSINMTSNATYDNNNTTGATTDTRQPMTGNSTHNTHNPFTGDGVVNTHNPLTGDKTGPHPPPGTNPVTGRSRDGELGRNEQQPVGHGATGAGVTSGANTHNTHNPLTGNGATNTHNPLTGDKTGPHPPAGTNPVTGRTRDDDLGRNEQHAFDQRATGTGTGFTSGTNTHNTHNPLTGDGATNTHNPLTGDKTGPHPPPGTNPVTGRTRDDELGRHEQQPGAYEGGTGTGRVAGMTGTGAGMTEAGTGVVGTNTHNTHNPLTGDGVVNTHNPLTGDETGSHPVTGRTREGELGRHERGAGYENIAYGAGAGAPAGSHAIHDTTRGTHAGTYAGTHTGTGTTGVGAAGTGAAGTGTTGAQPTSTTSSGTAKALVGKVEATLGSIINNPEMHAKGVLKQEQAHATRAARQQDDFTSTTGPRH
ncbi:hypothetical protein CTheo_2406 [Ceratobasidium theobromae]|uniref:Uncharacterized protein n=1 Tax=Ceratobasidium theobromae TaxID=1582974 RepID=A0A5N5QR15_9AGAM|nr:hypothetical protein CTheo_2406 [Ceratobasidium theobromae]